MAKNKEQTTALVKLDAYPLLLQPPAEAAELILHNMGGTLEVGDLPRIKIPSGGGKAFEIPRLDGEAIEKEFDCILLYRRTNRNKAYWQSRSITGSPPDCFSDDSIVGIGLPGGACSDCNHNKFGSAINDQGESIPGKACKDIQLIFPLLSGDSLPYAMPLPPTSLRPFAAYCSMLTQAALPYYAVITTVSLKEAQSKSGITYSQAAFRVSRDANGNLQQLDAEQAANIKALVYGDSDRPGLAAQLDRVRATETDYGDAES
jgi:hypothetical protein